MGRVSADAYQTHRITATNVGATVLRLQFLLEEYPEFRVCLSANDAYSDVGERLGDIHIPEELGEIKLKSRATKLFKEEEEILGSRGPIEESNCRTAIYVFDENEQVRRV